VQGVKGKRKRGEKEKRRKGENEAAQNSFSSLRRRWQPTAEAIFHYATPNRCRMTEEVKKGKLCPAT